MLLMMRMIITSGLVCLTVYENSLSLLAFLYHWAYVREKWEDENTFIPITLNGNIFSSSLRVPYSWFVSRLRQTVKAPVKFGMPWPSLFSFFSPFTQNTKDQRNSRASEKLRNETEAIISISIRRQLIRTLRFNPIVHQIFRGGGISRHRFGPPKNSDQVRL